LILSSFPVAWPDGGIHNCGLYVESPKKPDTKATQHHFSKKNHADKDFQYKKADGTRYRLTTDEDCSEEQLPNNVLNDTEIAINDVNQSGGATKLTTSNNDDFISTIGICLDYRMGVEKNEVRELILQLQRNKQTIPLQCKHVITFNTISRVPANIVSTVSHADPKERAGISSERFMDMGFGYDAQMHFNKKNLRPEPGSSMTAVRKIEAPSPSPK
jgi:hypothetical protein